MTVNPNWRDTDWREPLANQVASRAGSSAWRRFLDSFQSGHWLTSPETDLARQRSDYDLLTALMQGVGG